MNKAVCIGVGVLVVHLLLREARKKAPQIRYVDTLPFNYNAITAPPFGIFIRQAHKGNSALLQHELVHWSQYQKVGIIPYYLNYGYWNSTHGYDKHPMELEARSNETEYCRSNYTACVRAGQASTISNVNFRK